MRHLKVVAGVGIFIATTYSLPYLITMYHKSRHVSWK